MPKKSVFLLTLLSLLYSNASHATVTMCVNMAALKTACVGKTANAPDFAVDWSVACGNTTVHGFGVCGIDMVDNIVAISPSINVNTNCYCKIVAPDEFSWHFIKTFTSEPEPKYQNSEDCDRDCASLCASKINTADADIDLFQ